MRIALGAARGLLYLHEQCNPKIIHRDVKAANILLDESFEAIVGDFRLAKLLEQRESHITTAVRGTVGHIAPEYLSTGQSSEKTDVYGFGILLLELITRQKSFGSAAGQFQKGTVLDMVPEKVTSSLNFNIHLFALEIVRFCPTDHFIQQCDKRIPVKSADKGNMTFMIVQQLV